MDVNEPNRAMVFFVAEKKYACVNCKDFLLNDEEEEIIIEKQYDIFVRSEINNKVVKGVVKFIGTEKSVLFELRKKTQIILPKDTQPNKENENINNKNDLTRKLKERDEFIISLQNDLASKDELISKQSGQIKALETLSGSYNIEK